MISFHDHLLPAKTMIQDFEDLSKKRKWEDSLQSDKLLSSSKTKYPKSILDTELHLETPLPLDWQRCLDIKSGQIYYFNTRTKEKTSRDPRISSHENMSLDLELNLPCGSSNKNKNHFGDNLSKYNNSSTKSNKSSIAGGGGGDGRQSWLSLQQPPEKEMITAVCKKCHMLVMMLKSSPSCPNCKFMYDQAPPNLFNRELSLLC